MPIFYKNPEIEKSVNFFLDAWLTWLTLYSLHDYYAYAWFYDQETDEFFPHQMILKFKEILIFRKGAALHVFQTECREKYANTFHAGWDAHSACPRSRQFSPKVAFSSWLALFSSFTFVTCFLTVASSASTQFNFVSRSVLSRSSFSILSSRSLIFLSFHSKLTLSYLFSSISFFASLLSRKFPHPFPVFSFWVTRFPQYGVQFVVEDRETLPLFNCQFPKCRLNNVLCKFIVTFRHFSSLEKRSTSFQLNRWYRNRKFTFRLHQHKILWSDRMKAWGSVFMMARSFHYDVNIISCACPTVK